jgi:hypothetical protein
MIIDTANKNAADIEREMNIRTDAQKEVLHRTTGEIEEFKNRILADYKRHMDTFEKIAKECENEFITETLGAYRKAGGSEFSAKNRDSQNMAQNRAGKNKNKNKKDSKQHEVLEKIEIESTSEIAKPKDDSILRINDDTIKFEIDVNEDYSSDETVEMNVKEIFGKSLDIREEDSPLYRPKSGNSDNKKTSEIFFKKSKGNSGRPKQLRYSSSSDND